MLKDPKALAAFSSLPLVDVDGICVPLGARDELLCYQQLREGRAVLALDERAWFFIRGGDAADFLQRICSQDCKKLAEGTGAQACLLSNKGRIQAFFWIFRPAPGAFIVETERSQVPTIFAILERYRFSEDVRWELPEDQAIFGVGGPKAAELLGEGLEAGGIREEAGGHLLRSDEFGVPLMRFLGSREAAEAVVESLAAGDVPLAGHRDFEALRIDACQPRLGLDSDDKTMPPEVCLDAACDPDKGCYVGQEVIARLATYGHLNRRLTRLLLASDRCPAPGSIIFDEGMEAGRLTSSYRSPVDQRVRALAMLPVLLLEEGGELRVGAADGIVASLLG